ncbi:MAG: HAMP domain-containing protein [Natronospirillum sp.]|uniref:sensor histidine kinase n=1 Tax=Natronospirillum sp. TaxID=2812955 RepID=UPI0025D2A644|nr:sensor histidine kinase [Natronospirillum sp.]MCH8551963.1 HAMP domain-containing protein [Natronospirillum sp.]
MSTPTQAHRRLFMRNAILLATSLLCTLIISVLIAFTLSYRTLVPQMIDLIELGFRALPENTDFQTLWSRRSLSEDNLPDLIEVVALYEQGQLVAEFNRTPRRALPAQAEFLPEQASLPRQHRLVDLGPSGRWQLFVVGNATLMHSFYRQTLLGLFLLAALSAALVVLVSYRFQRAISSPLRHLMSVARQIDQEENFTIRAHKGPEDDIGDLVDSFNAMLQRVETRDVQLQSERDKAEKAQVQAQTLAQETRDANQRLEFEVQVRSRVERKLTEFQAYLNAMINSMPSALIAVDEHALITQWNDEASRLSGRSLDMALGYSLDEAFPLLEGYMESLSRALLDKQIQRIERVHYQRAEQELILDMVIYPLHLTGIIGAVIRIDDVSDKVRMEEMMVQSEKMMSVGGLAAGMAHEINNPLSAVVQSAQTIRRRLSTETPANQKAADEFGLDMDQLMRYLDARDIPRFLDHILTSGERAAAIVTNMLQFSRQSSTGLQPADISELIERALAIAMSDLNLRQDLQEGDLTIEKDLEDCRNLKVPVANTEIEQVLFNLLKNAWQAVQDRPDPETPGLIRVECQKTSHHCVIKVTDNGRGMDAQTRKRVFEPFFTTKEVGQGTGLGLSVAYFIVTSHHHGQLSVNSGADSGTTFTIRLPLQPPEQNAG